jgi:hypothetical protein
MLSRAAAAEIVSGHENLRTFRQLKFRSIFEQMLTNAGFVGNFQEPRRDDLIGIDVFLR